MKNSISPISLVVVFMLSLAACRNEGKPGPSDSVPGEAGLAQSSGGAPSNAEPTRQEVLESVARQFDPEVPYLVDADTRLDDVSAGDDGKTLIYKYTIVNPATVKLIRSDATLLPKHVKNFVCGSLDKSGFLSEGFVFDLEYMDVEGEALARFSIDPKECT